MAQIHASEQKTNVNLLQISEALNSWQTNYRTGISGILNQGGTCYLNTLLQTLLHTPDFTRRLFAMAGSMRVDELKRILQELLLLFSRLKNGNGKPMSAKQLTDSFGWSGEEVFVHQDIQELNRLLFEQLEIALKGTAETNLINDLYRGVLQTKIKCWTCGRISERNDEFLDVNLSISACDSVEDSLKAHTQTEILSGDNQYFCDQCKQRVDASKESKFKELPPILTLSLSRFYFDADTMESCKLDKMCRFPLTLNMSEYLIGEYHESAIYELFSIVIHVGGTTFGGHYHAYIRDPYGTTNFLTQKAAVKINKLHRGKIIDGQTNTNSFHKPEIIFNDMYGEQQCSKFLPFEANRCCDLARTSTANLGPPSSALPDPSDKMARNNFLQPSETPPNDLTINQKYSPIPQLQKSMHISGSLTKTASAKHVEKSVSKLVRRRCKDTQNTSRSIDLLCGKSNAFQSSVRADSILSSQCMTSLVNRMKGIFLSTKPSNPNQHKQKQLDCCSSRICKANNQPHLSPSPLRQKIQSSTRNRCDIRKDVKWKPVYQRRSISHLYPRNQSHYALLEQCEDGGKVNAECEAYETDTESSVILEIPGELKNSHNNENNSPTNISESTTSSENSDRTTEWKSKLFTRSNPLRQSTNISKPSVTVSSITMVDISDDHSISPVNESNTKVKEDGEFVAQEYITIARSRDVKVTKNSSKEPCTTGNSNTRNESTDKAITSSCTKSLEDAKMELPESDKDKIVYGRWFDFNDDVVTRIESDQFENVFSGPECAYMLFFRRIDENFPMSS